jgi:hypothetical protein
MSAYNTNIHNNHCNYNAELVRATITTPCNQPCMNTSRSTNFALSLHNDILNGNQNQCRLGERDQLVDDLINKVQVLSDEFKNRSRSRSRSRGHRSCSKKRVTIHSPHCLNEHERGDRHRSHSRSHSRGHSHHRSHSGGRRQYNPNYHFESTVTVLPKVDCWNPNGVVDKNVY